MKRRRFEPARRRGANKNARGEHRALFKTITDSPEFLALSPEAKLVFVLLKLELGLSGIGVLYKHVLAIKSGYDDDTVLRTVSELCDTRWLVAEQNVFWLRNGLKFEPSISVANPKHKATIEKHLRSLPKLPIVNNFAAYYKLETPFPELVEPDTVAGTVQRTVSQSLIPDTGTGSTSSSPMRERAYEALSDYLGAFRSSLDRLQESAIQPPGCIPALWGLYGPHGTEHDLIFATTPESERPRILSIAMDRLAGESQPYQGQFFRRILETVRDEQGRPERKRVSTADPRRGRATSQKYDYSNPTTEFKGLRT